MAFQNFRQTLPNLIVLTGINYLAGMEIWRVYVSQFFQFWLFFCFFVYHIVSLIIQFSAKILIILLHPYSSISDQFDIQKHRASSAHQTIFRLFLRSHLMTQKTGTAKNTVISPDFLVCIFYGKAQWRRANIFLFQSLF